jgi:hypothetical protein
MKTILTLCVLLFLYTFSFGQEGGEMEWGKVERADSVALHKTFVELVASIEQKEIQKARNVSLAGIDCNLCLSREHGVDPPKDDVVPIDTFSNQALVDFVGSPLYKAIKEEATQPLCAYLRILRQEIFQSVIRKICVCMRFGFRPINPMNGQPGTRGKAMLSSSLRLTTGSDFTGLLQYPNQVEKLKAKFDHTH